MTMDVNQLRAKLCEHQSAMFHQGFLDDQFSQLQNLQDESTPDFVLEVVTMFFDDSENLLKNMARCLEQVPADFKQIDAYAHQYKGSSARLLVLQELKVFALTSGLFVRLRTWTGECMECLQQLQHEYSLLKNHLQYLFKLQKDIKAGGGSFS
ncbi:hypothetical protein V8G54_028151 [Vigna mungo]|uniref:Histidine-containing phosphotransfer protein n=1 Tax=Vigna mungo TaxID=3915 RepID=A0AAQ3MS42_VIGMU